VGSGNTEVVHNAVGPNGLDGNLSAVTQACTLTASAVALPPVAPYLQRISKHPRVMHYNRLVTLVVVVNIGWAVYAASVADWWTSAGTDLRALAMLAQANLAVAVLARQQYVINALAWLVTRPPTSWPLRLRWALGKYYHFGGVHVGSAVAGTAWYLILVVSLFRDAAVGVTEVSHMHMAVAATIATLLAVMVVTALPPRLVWVTKNPRRTYGDELIDEIEAVHPDATIWDTSERGKPDVLQLAYAAYVESGAEAVVCIANRTATWQVVHGLESRGIPAFGPIWDS
jgi:hypothetical protein